MLNLITAPFNNIVNKIRDHRVADTFLMAPTIDPDDLDYAIEQVERPTASLNRIEPGVPRHTWYADRFSKLNTPTRK